MKFITKVLTAVVTTAATTATGVMTKKWLMEKKEDEWTKQQMTSAERLALPTLAKQLPTKHAICLKVKNKTNSVLHNPQVYSASGQVTGSVPRVVEPGEYKCMAAQKTASYYYKGISGIVTYDIGDTKNRLCIYYYNPYFGNNAFTFQWDNDSRPVDEDLFEQMSHGSDIWSPKGTVTWHSKANQSYEVYGFISQGDPAYLHVVVCDK